MSRIVHSIAPPLVSCEVLVVLSEGEVPPRQTSGEQKRA